VNVDVTVYLNGFHGIVLAPLSDHRVNFIQAGSRLLLLYMRSLNCRLKSGLSRIEHTISKVLAQSYVWNFHEVWDPLGSCHLKSFLF
jgi:hypothetical protein